MPFELSSGGGGVDGHCCQFFVREPATRSALNFRAQALDQFRRMRIWIEWMTA